MFLLLLLVKLFQGNRLFKEGKFELAKAKYEKVPGHYLHYLLHLLLNSNRKGKLARVIGIFPVVSFIWEKMNAVVDIYLMKNVSL